MANDRILSTSKTQVKWTEEELLLALRLYLEHGPLSSTDSKVISLSTYLRKRNFPQAQSLGSDFRNCNSVALKLSNFAAIDPSYPGSGMSRFSKKDKAIWDKYSSDETFVKHLCSLIDTNMSMSFPEVVPKMMDIPLEKYETQLFAIQKAKDKSFGLRKESFLLQRFVRHLEEQNKELCRFKYNISSISVFCDLFNKTDNMLIEAKGDTSRESVRMAVGQLLDYSRFHASLPNLGVLLPQKPSSDILLFLQHCKVVAFWKHDTGWGDSSHGIMEPRTQ